MKLYFITAQSLASGDIFVTELTDGVINIKDGTVHGALPGFAGGVVVYNNLDYAKVKAELVRLIGGKAEAILALKRKAAKAAMRDAIAWDPKEEPLGTGAPIPGPKRESVVTSDGSA